MLSLDVAPLWPAGHLPHTGGDHAGRSIFANLGRCKKSAKVEAANLPPCGGDGRQARGGREGTQPYAAFAGEFPA